MEDDQESLCEKIEDATGIVQLLRQEQQSYNETTTLYIQQVAELHRRTEALLESSQTTNGTLFSLSQDLSVSATTVQQVLRYFPWKVAGYIALVLTVLTLVINGIWMVKSSASHRQELAELTHFRELALALDQYMIEELYKQLSPQQKKEVDAIYKKLNVTEPGSRVNQQNRAAPVSE